LTAVNGRSERIPASLKNRHREPGEPGTPRPVPRARRRGRGAPRRTAAPRRRWRPAPADG